MFLIVIVVLVLLMLLIAAIVAIRTVRRATAEEEVEGTTHPSTEDEGARQIRHAEADRRGTELIERRVELDVRRGALGGDTQLDNALQTLEQNYRAGKIDESTFEAEKRRLLGG